jgi:hypothetical protein
MLKTLAALILPILCIAAAPANDIEHNARREQEFAAFNPHFKDMKSERTAIVRALAAQVAAREAAGESTACSHQILRELKLLTYLSADFTAIDRRIADLRGSLDHPERESSAAAQDPQDGSFGTCYESWHLKLRESYEHRADKAARPFRFLDRVNSPEKLTAYLTSIATSDISRTGIDRTFELNESLSDLMRLILHDQPKDYPWDPRLKQALMDLLLHRLRNPETGWWGESYVRDGRVKFVDDLSMTFHTVAYLEGKVPDLPKIVDTALAVKSLNFPSGWLWDGAYWNNLTMDVVVLFGYGWPQASAAQRVAMRAELEKMLHWCLTESLQPDGSFKPVAADVSLEDANYFGAAFLARAGYFDRARRFWTDEEFPGSGAIRKKIVDHATAHHYASVLEELR